MKIATVLTFGSLVALVAAPAAADDAKMLSESREVAQTLVNTFSEALKKEMEKGGALSAIDVCKDLAPDTAASLSKQTGWKVSRVSLKVRNPLLGMPDAWERATLLEFEKRLAAGQGLPKLELGEVVDEGGQKYFRYAKAIPVQNVCVKCHGKPEELAEGVGAKLKAEYPKDKATGYEIGQLRGAITIKRPLP